jgi:type II secretory pathway pseudopilin PulG
VLPGDAGQAGAAIDAYRTAGKQPAVPTTVSSGAQTCALNSGDGAACSASYFWEPVPTLDGSALVAKIAAKSSGAAWLLDPKATSFAVGWAYAPGAAGKAGLIEAVLFKVD